MHSLSLRAVAQNLDYLSFDIYLSPTFAHNRDIRTLARADSGSQDLILLKEFLANLAVEGVLCSRAAPPNPNDAWSAIESTSVAGTEPIPVPVTLIRSKPILNEFEAACRTLEEEVGPRLNGHAPTVFAASRIAHSTGNELSTLFSYGGLNILAINDILISEKGRGDAQTDPPRQTEADMKQKKPPVPGVYTGALRKALSDAELLVLKAELKALEEDRKKGEVPNLTEDEAIAVFQRGLG